MCCMRRLVVTHPSSLMCWRLYIMAPCGVFSQKNKFLFTCSVTHPNTLCESLRLNKYAECFLPHKTFAELICPFETLIWATSTTTEGRLSKDESYSPWPLNLLWHVNLVECSINSRIKLYVFSCCFTVCFTCSSKLT